MTENKLIPFDPKQDKGLQIRTQFEIFKGILQVSFYIYDPENSIDGLNSENKQMNSRTLTELDRMDELWKNTCFEFFLKKSDSANYFEFNANAQGKWNFYRFSKYRSPIEKEPSISKLKMSLDQQGTEKKLSFMVDLNPLFSVGDSLLFSFSAVIVQSSQVSYWAHKHSSEKPDFHHVNNFTIEAKFK